MSTKKGINNIFPVFDKIFNYLPFYMDPEPNISKLLQIQSAMWGRTIVLFVLENTESSFGLQSHKSSSLVCKADSGSLTFMGCFFLAKPVLLQ